MHCDDNVPGFEHLTPRKIVGKILNSTLEVAKEEVKDEPVNRNEISPRETLIHLEKLMDPHTNAKVTLRLLISCFSRTKRQILKFKSLRQNFLQKQIRNFFTSVET